MDRRVLFLLTLFLYFSGVIGLASSTPTIPKMGEDLALFGEKSAKAFFAERFQNTECREQLERHRTKFLGYKAKLAIMTHKDNIAKYPLRRRQAWAERLKESREQMLARMKECGECALREVERITVPADQSESGVEEIWFQSDGSCWLGPNESNASLSRYDAIRKWLLRAWNHPQRNGGFRNLLELIEVNYSTGETISDPTEFPEKAFVAVKGEALGFLKVFAYYVNNWVDYGDSSDLKEMQLSFNYADPPPPEKFSRPRIEDISDAGEKTYIQKKWSSNVLDIKGGWYAHSKDYIRYFNAAIFDDDLAKWEPMAHIIKKMAEDIHLSTMVHLVLKTAPSAENSGPQGPLLAPQTVSTELSPG